jgi:hypothetical protein
MAQGGVEWEDALGNGAVLKRTINHGPDAAIKPEFKQEVTVHVKGFVQTDQSSASDERDGNLPERQVGNTPTRTIQARLSII